MGQVAATISMSRSISAPQPVSPVGGSGYRRVWSTLVKHPLLVVHAPRLNSVPVDVEVDSRRWGCRKRRRWPRSARSRVNGRGRERIGLLELRRSQPVLLGRRRQRRHPIGRGHHVGVAGGGPGHGRATDGALGVGGQGRRPGWVGVRGGVDRGRHDQGGDHRQHREQDGQGWFAHRRARFLRDDHPVDRRGGGWRPPVNPACRIRLGQGAIHASGEILRPGVRAPRRRGPCGPAGGRRAGEQPPRHRARARPPTARWCRRSPGRSGTRRCRWR